MKSTTLMIKSIVLFIFLWLSAVDSGAEPWRGIVPLKSTRVDVERLLGKPIPGELNFEAKYKLEKEEVRIHYSVKKFCREAERCECRVPDDTVKEISVESRLELRFSTLGVDKSKFESFPLVEDVSILVYFNRVAGLIYAVRDDKVLYTQYSGSEKNCEKVLRKL